jgi:hypothetical protein
LAARLKNVELQITELVMRITHFGGIAKIQKDNRVIKKISQYPFQ